MFLGLKKVFFGGFVILFAGFLFFSLVDLDGNVAYANTCTSNATGSWGVAGTWTSCGGVTPQVGDDVVIANTHDVTIVTGSINAVNNITIQNGGTLTQNNTSTQTISGILLIEDGGTLTHGQNNTTHEYSLIFEAATITLDAGVTGGVITASARGYAGGPSNAGGADGYAPDGTGGQGSFGANQGGGGGAHYGAGGVGDTDNAGGTAYDSATNPIYLGAGGAGAADGGDNSAKGGDGGGYISLTASGTITVNGSIYANGQNPWHFVDGGGGGGGGVIKLVANTVAGTPKNTISARGGNASDAGGDDGGGGGGGIIYIGHSSGNSILSVNVSGGTANGVATAGGDGVFTVEQLNTAPTVTIDSAEQDDNEGTVYVTITISDSDGDDTLNVKVEYKAGADCSSGTSKPDLSEESADLTSTQFPNRPKPSIENDNTYQIGDGNGDVTTETWIETDPGVTPNELEFVWNSATDEAAADGTYCIKVTPNDNTSDGTSVTETLVLDNVDPVSAGDLTLDSIAADSLTLMRCLETRKPGIPPEFVKECDDVLLDLINRGLVEAVRRDDGTAGFRLCE